MTALEASRRLCVVMFTDMVGYTALFQADERDALARRDAYVAAVERAHGVHGGQIVARMGDGTMSTFSSAVEAVLAAIEIQRELVPTGIGIRIGAHAGEVIDDGVTILGDAVNLASRVESFAVPGGVLVSDAIADLVQNRPDLAFVSLGPFRLKNVGSPVELLAVCNEGVVVPDAAALEGKGERYASLPSRLPEPPGALLGRDSDVERLGDAVRGCRLVTVTGPGGVGKTRLLVELGHRLLTDFLDGVAFVELADVAAPEDFIPALAESLDVKEAEERTLVDGITALIGSGRGLLLLDNFEQLVDAAPDVAALVAACPQLHVVVTSRTRLRLTSEYEIALAPLQVPNDGASAAALSASPAVALFVDRARTSGGAFELTDANATVVAAICRRLDGLPLAIELAAARLRLLTPESLFERLDHALEVLTSGPRDLPARHQTLRATIDWSHSLLTESEQRLFRRMSVFAGGCTFDALEDVCGDEQTPCLDGLESLLDKALVRSSVDGRFSMLQTIGEYAAERLVASGESDEVSARHARALLKVAREVRDGLEAHRQVAALEQGIVEEQNLQVALDTLLQAARVGDEAAATEGLRACGDLMMYWHIRGKNLTARDVSTAFLELAGKLPASPATAGALRSAGLGSWALGQIDVANDRWESARAIADAAGDRVEQCLTDLLWCFGLIGVDAEHGKRRATQAIELARELNYEWAEELALTVLGILFVVTGEIDEAHAPLLEALAIQERIGDYEGLGLSVGTLAEIAAVQGEAESALGLYDRSLEAFGRVGDRAEEARILSDMAGVLLAGGDAEAARERYCDSIRAYSDVGSVRGVGLSLLGLAAVAALMGRPEASVAIAAAGDRYAREEGIVNVYSDDAPGFAVVDVARGALLPEALERAHARGVSLSIDEAVELARSNG